MYDLNIERCLLISAIFRRILTPPRARSHNDYVIGQRSQIAAFAVASFEMVPVKKRNVSIWILSHDPQFGRRGAGKLNS